MAVERVRRGARTTRRPGTPLDTFSVVVRYVCWASGRGSECEVRLLYFEWPGRAAHYHLMKRNLQEMEDPGNTQILVVGMNTEIQRRSV